MINILLLLNLTTENFTARLKQANLVNKNDFDKKTNKSFYRQITSNKIVLPVWINV